MNDETGMAQKKVDAAYFKVWFQHLSEGADENHDICQSDMQTN